MGKDLEAWVRRLENAQPGLKHVSSYTDGGEHETYLLVVIWVCGGDRTTMVGGGVQGQTLLM